MATPSPTVTYGGELREDLYPCSLSDRVQLISHWCRDHRSGRHDTSTGGTHHRAIYSKDRGCLQLLLCAIEKVASMASMRYFSSLSQSGGMETFVYQDGRKIPNGRYYALDGATLYNYGEFEEVRGIPRSVLTNNFSNYTKMILVRHPLQRLVAAYYQLRPSDEGRGRTDTFAQFVQEMVLAQEPNDHYKPYIAACDPCSIHYNYVLKLENLKPELRQVNIELGVDPLATMPEYHINQEPVMSADGWPYKYDSVLRQLESSHPDLFKRLLEAYRADLEMFGYTWTEQGSGCGYRENGCC